ncbi:MAG: NmrA family NAD(P)-binding protein [Gammaproteobacteria bacterium]
MILIAGARNFVGIEVARQLATLDYPLRVVVADTAEARLFDEFPNVEVLRLEPHTEIAANAFRGVEMLFLTAPACATEARTQRRLTRAARSVGIKRVVRLTHADEDPDALTPVMAPAEKARPGDPPLPCTSLRAGVSYQSLTVFLLHFTCTARRVLAHGREIAPVDARDVAAVAVAVLTGQRHAGERFCVTGPEALSLVEIADKLSFATGVRVSPGRRVACGSEQADKWSGWEAGIEAELATGSGTTETTLGDTIRRIAGREPIPFDEYGAEIATRCPIFRRLRDLA